MKMDALIWDLKKKKIIHCWLHFEIDGTMNNNLINAQLEKANIKTDITMMDHETVKKRKVLRLIQQ